MKQKIEIPGRITALRIYIEEGKVHGFRTEIIAYRKIPSLLVKFS